MPASGSDPNQQRPEPYFNSAHGAVYYSPQSPTDWRRRATAPPSFPTPPIQPRERRPHSIHIVSYPAGFIPHELRQRPSPAPVATDPSSKKRKHRKKNKETKSRRGENSESERQGKKIKKNKKQKQEQKPKTKDKDVKKVTFKLFPPRGKKQQGKLGRFLVSIFSTAKPPAGPPGTNSPTPPQSVRVRGLAGFARRLSLFDFYTPSPDEIEARPASMADTLRPSSLGLAGTPNRNSFMSMRPGKLAVNSSVVEVAKPVASGSGVTCSILLAEPNVFLTGFDHDSSHHRRETHGSTSLLRGKLQLRVSKSVKIKSITLKLVGKARTEWPEGIPPNKVDMFEEQTLRSQSLVFFHAMHEGIWETQYGNQCRFALKTPHHGPDIMSSDSPTHSHLSLPFSARPRQPKELTPKELKRLSLQSVNSRSFGKGESPLANQVQAKGYKIFAPGTYDYAFELPIDHHQLETTKLQYGSVKWELETTVERAGAFKPNLHGSKELSIVRVPDQMSLEMTEPISISRQWEDQLHYDIMISGKSFPIGSKIPIAFKLTPLAKVQVHKLKVFVTESVEYWTNDRHVTRKDPGRKILLLEKAAGKPLERQYEGSEVRVLSGGELAPEERVEARRAATARRSHVASRSHTAPEPLPEPADNLLGDLDLGLEHYWGSTEIEMNVQIPTCETMAKDKTIRLHPDCSWKNVNVYHWIKIVMRISRLDPEDPAGKRRRHFEISIDSPFTVLNCRATQANTALPQYCGLDGSLGGEQTSSSCGCPDASVFTSSPASSTGHLALVERDSISPVGTPGPPDRVNSNLLPAAPQSAYMNSSPLRQNSAQTRQTVAPIQRPEESHAGSSNPHSSNEDVLQPRPIHLIRVPSYNPPAFDAEDPPPALPYGVMTPPPNYDAIIGTPSVDGMADYFARLTAYEGPQTTIAGVIASDPIDAALRDSGISLENAEAHSAVLSRAGGVAGHGGDDFFSYQAPGAIADEVESDSDDNDDPARPHHRGRVNVANPRTPGGRLVPSRSLEIERPAMPLSMAGVVRRGE